MSIVCGMGLSILLKNKVGVMHLVNTMRRVGQNGPSSICMYHGTHFFVGVGGLLFNIKWL